MKTKHLLIFFCMIVMVHQCVSAQQKQQLTPSPQVLQQFVQQHHLNPGGIYRYYDSAQKKSYLFSAKTDQIINQKENARGAKGAVSQGITGGVQTHNFHLVQDINTSKDANPFTSNFNKSTDTFTVVNNVIYYSADDGIHGTELWRSDGTAAGTYLVKDIVPGTESSSPDNITASGNMLFFSIYNPLSATYQLWKTDGTPAGTVLVYDFVNQPNAQQTALCNLNGTLYFVTSGTSYYNQLWKTDGTDTGTVLVKDIFVSDTAYNVFNLTAADGLVFFTAFSQNFGNELWRSDGTANGTYSITSIGATAAAPGPSQLTAYNNMLYFAEDNGSGNFLWVSDGTAGGTSPATGTNNVAITANRTNYENIPFVNSNNVLYFAGFAAATGTELYKYDAASTQGVIIVKDITPGNGVSNIYGNFLTDVNGTVYFLYSDNLATHLYKTNGTDSSTVDVKDFTSAAQDYYGLSNGNGELYFSSYSATDGIEPWVSNGTAAGTVLLKDVYPGSVSSEANYFTTCNGRVLFAAQDSLHGNELWMSDGLAAGTTLVKDVNTTSTSSSAPVYVTPYNSNVVFSAYTYNKGNELWQSTGTGAQLVKDIYAGQNSSFPERFYAKNGYAYFRGHTSTSGGVFKTDGTVAGTVQVTPDFNGALSAFTVTDNGNVFYYLYNSNDNKYELWKTDGTAAGNVLLNSSIAINIFTLNNDHVNFTRQLFTVGNTIFFSAYNADLASGDYELWKSDGTANGTVLVKDINAGTGSSGFNYPVAFDNEVFFSAYDGTETALWKSDGTASGTVKVQSVQPQNFVLVNNILFFNGTTAATGSELWKTDGTTGGTVLVRDIDDGTGSSYPNNFTAINNTVYFTASGPIYGSELWNSDGTEANTHRVKDITPGGGSTSFNSFAAAAGKLFFNINDTLWQSDGTDSGTGKVQDEGLANVIVEGNLVGNGSKLFFEGYSYTTGDELYEGDVTNTILPANLLSFNAQLKGTDVLTAWQTADEADMLFFNVQRSTDVINFTSLGKVTASGNGSKLHGYTYTDLNVANLLSADKVYYRLQITGKDGNTTFSNIVPVELGKKAPALVVYPNPAKEVVNLQVTNYSGSADMVIQTISGATVHHRQLQVQNSSVSTLNISGLSAGTYLIEIKVNGTVLKQQFIKQ